MLGELPPIPVAEVNGQKLLRPAESFSHKSNSENTELYAVFPYRLYGVGRPDLDLARATYQARGHRHNHGWCQDSIQAACLGLGDEAARLVSARASQINRAYRFPAMWGPNFDWIPDQDHGNNILTTLQYMLLQDDGERHLRSAGMAEAVERLVQAPCAEADHRRVRSPGWQGGEAQGYAGKPSREC